MLHLNHFNRKQYVRLFLLAAAILMLPGWITALAYPTGTTVTVTDTTDLSDLNPGDGMCDTDLGAAGEQCSLRAAIEELNALGPDTPPHRIHFNIPGGGPFTISPASPLPDIAVPMVIFGNTQPGSACPTLNTPASLMIVLDGSNAGTGAAGLVLDYSSSGSIVAGLVIGNFDAHGIRLLSNSNFISCNHIGVAADGVTDIGNGSHGILDNGDNNTIGGRGAHAQRNVISGNAAFGVRLESTTGSLVANNFIGTSADGMSAIGNSTGIYLNGDGNQIGGTTITSHNLVSGNHDAGIRLNSGEFNTIQGNLVGIARDGITPLPNAMNGIDIVGAALSNVIGGVNPSEANWIANNGASGVALDVNSVGTPAQNTLRGNHIYANANQGIDLGDDGLTNNDSGDADGGENESQNFPLLATTPGSPVVVSDLNSLPGAEFTIDVYRSDDCDPGGFGEGQQHILTYSATTDGAGNASDPLDLSGLVADGDAVTATATDLSGNTSEFSACVTISLPPPTATLSPTPTASATAGPSPTPTFTPTTGPSLTPTPTLDPTEFPPTPTDVPPSLGFSLYLPGLYR